MSDSSQPLFSIITSVNLWNLDRIAWFMRCIDSVRNQICKDFEWVIVDDGSTEPFLWKEVLEGLPVTLIHKDHAERVIGYNAGFKAAKGQWYTLLDSDDEYSPEYLERLKQIIAENPDYKFFNFGAIYKHTDGKVTQRPPFEPPMKDVGHEVFGGGNIPWGTFMFHRSIYDALGGYPPEKIEGIDCTPINYGGVRDLFMNTPFDFSAYAQIEFPELRQFFMVDHEAEPDKIIKEMGNPWGQDVYLFYKYTRKYHSKPVKEYLYIVHPKV